MRVRSQRMGRWNGYKPQALSHAGGDHAAGAAGPGGAISTELFARYQRCEQAQALDPMELSLNGASIRKVTAITEELCGIGFSKSRASALPDGWMLTWPPVGAGR